MQLGDSSMLENSNNKPLIAVAATPSEVVAQEGANGGEMEVDANSCEEKGREGGGDPSDKMIRFGGNRWPRQETLALLKIRSDMDAMFRDSCLKVPLWEEVSRKLAELGYHRCARKCKEKFENVCKYHKRTKESRSNKLEGKTYKFFDQIEALQNQFKVSYPPKLQPILVTTTKPSNSGTSIFSYVTSLPSTNPTTISPLPPCNDAAIAATTTSTVSNPRNPSSQGNNNMNLFSTTTTSTSSSTASDEDLEERYGKKRKWKDYFRRLTNKVLAKQEEIQKKFLEAVDKRDRERVAKQDSWRMQEIKRINRENEILDQVRSTSAAKDASLITFLQKLSGQQNPTQNGNSLQIIIPLPLSLPPPPEVEIQTQLPQSQSQPQPQTPTLGPNSKFEIIQRMNNGHSFITTTTTPMNSSSRWPKAEVHALIRQRTSVEVKYQENGPKAPMWEEISSEMQTLGYNRSAKRCKQKWENINKYFKKVKESKKQRHEDSKTCPYYEELDALYKEKIKKQNSSGFLNMNPNEMMETLVVQPEQQWRTAPESEPKPLEENNENHEEEDDEHEDNDNDDDVEDEDGKSMEDEEASGYENATNKLFAVDTVE